MSVSPMNLGAKGNGTTDDHKALQAAIDKGAEIPNQWVDGGFRTYAVSQPLVLRPSSRFRSLVLKALPTYAPADPTNAMLMTSQGNKRAFTSAGGVITTAGNHVIPSDGIPVVFKGTLPSPLVAGRLYYAFDRTPTTFKVSATVGGPALDVATGAGDVYCEVLSLDRCYLDDVYVDGQNVPGVNGINANLQQPAQWVKVRAQNCKGYGVAFGGQQWECRNLEVVNCGVGIKFYGPAFEGYFYATNVEQCTTGIVLAKVNHTAFWGLHMEGNDVHLHFPPGSEVQALAIDTPHIDIGAFIPVLCESTATTYEIRNFRPYGGGGPETVIEDRARHYTLTRNDWGDSSSWESSFVQPRGNRPPLRVVRP